MMSSRHLPVDVLKTSSRRRPQDLFQETSSRPLPGDVLKMSKTSSRLFLVKGKDPLETNYGFSIYIRFKLFAYRNYQNFKNSNICEGLIQMVCKNDEIRVFLSQIFFVFYNKEIYKRIL